MRVTMEHEGSILHDNLPIIEVADSLTLDQLLADASTAPFLLVRLSERMAVIDPEHFDTLITRLRKLGHLPKVVG